MDELRELSQRELAEIFHITERDVSLSVARNEPMPNGAGHWVFFSLSANKDLLARLEVGVDHRLALDKSWLERHS